MDRFAPRPEFEPIDSPTNYHRRAGILPWLRLTRLPNVFTAIADVAMGYLFVHGSFASPGKLACLTAASALLYTAGMVLNDVFDFAVDAKERPFRPLPAGQIGLPTARVLGFALLVLGVGCGWLAGFVPDGEAALPWRSGVVASVLAACVLAYDGWLKSTPIGPLGMGACRFLNVLLGMGAAPEAAGGIFGYSGAEFLAAGGVGVYIIGVTWFARREADQSDRLMLVAAILVMAVGVMILGASAAYRLQAGHRQAMDPALYWLLLALLMVSVVRRCGAAVIDPVPQKVQAAVKHSILSLIWLDAATAAAVAGPMHGIAVAALLVPALILGRWVYST